MALGERIQLARLRRDWTAENVAYRASISRKTLHNVETGKPTVAIGTYLQVLFVLGLKTLKTSARRIPWAGSCWTWGC